MLSAGTHTFNDFGQTLINANLSGGTTNSLIQATGLAGLSQRAANIVRCGDAGDLARYEYVKYGVRDSSKTRWRLLSENFSQARWSAYFTLEELNWGDYSGALIRQPLIIGAATGYRLDKWRDNYGVGMTVNSGYGNPAHNATIGRAPDSRKWIPLAIGCLGLAALSILNPQSAAAAQADLIVAAVRSANWEVRRDAFTALIGADAANLASQSGQAADRRKQLLIELLATENDMVAAKGRQLRRDGDLPPVDALSETYVNYYADVIAAVATLRDPRSVSALAGAISTGSMAPSALISFGVIAVEPVARRLTDEDPVRRTSVAHLLSEMLASSNQVAKNAKSRAIIKKTLAAAARDTDYHVRRRAIPGLVRLGDAESIAIVEDLARNDAYVDNMGDAVPWARTGWAQRRGGGQASNAAGPTYSSAEEPFWQHSTRSICSARRQDGSSGDWLVVFRTAFTPGSERTRWWAGSIPDSLCAGASISVEFHSHTESVQRLPSGFDPPGSYLSGPTDMSRADSLPARKFYLKAPNDIASPASHVINYCVGGSASALYNTYERVDNGWVKIPYPKTPRPWQAVQSQPCSAQ